MALEEVVLRELKSQGASRDALTLWPELWDAFEEGGPEAVRGLLQEKVRLAKRRAERQAREMRSAAAVAPAKPKARRKRPVKRGQ